MQEVIEIRVESYEFNDPTQACSNLASRLASGLQRKVGILSDAQTKNAIKEIIQFSHKADYPNAELRMDYIAREIGLTSCMGTTAIISRRLLAVTHYHSQGMVEGVVLLTQSYQNTVIQANKGKSTKVSGNGNRASSESLISTIQSLGDTYRCPTVILELSEN